MLTDTVCFGDSVLIGSVWYSTSGLYYDTLSNQFGCDSLLATSLTVVGPLGDSLTATLCFGDSIFVGGAWQSTAGSYSDTLAGFWGCDSIAVTTVSVLTQIIGNDSVQLCPGDSAFLAGAWQTAPGFYTDSLTASGGCDSIVTTELQWITYPLAFDTTAICLGDSILLGGVWQDTAGTYNDTLIAASSG